MPTLPEGTLTFLLTDIEGSTLIWEQEPRAMAAGMVHHDQLFEEAVGHFAGYVVRPRGEGNSRFAVFPSAVNGNHAAVRFQRALHQAEWQTSGPLQARAALHTGEADLRQGDYYGSTVNRCARIRGLAHGGQTLVSGTTATLVRTLLEDDVTLVDLGVHSLRDIAEPEHIYQIAGTDLPAEFPPLLSAPRRPGNLPAETSSFIGQEREVEVVRSRLADPIFRLVTLVGPGGTGKTRLAIHSARELLPEFQDGVWFIALASLEDHRLVLPTIAQTLGVQVSGDESILDALTEHIHTRSVLLVLDNMDHLLGAAPSLAALLAACPQLKLLITSREAPRLRGNQEIAIQPLDAPDPARHLIVEQAVQFASVRLFVERAREVDPMFEITSENVAAIVEICNRLDGLPLAIELAAARIRLFSPQALLSRLDRRLAILTGGAVDLPARQQTLRNTIAWSYDYLEEWEQVLFRRLAVFRGGFTLEAAAAVCEFPTGDDTLGEADLLNGVASLISKSLLRRFNVWSDLAEPRFGMLVTIREFGFEQLEQHGEIDLVHSQHARYFAGLAERAEQALPTAEQDHWAQLLDNDLDNLRSALTWTHGSGNTGLFLRLTAALWPFWDLRGYLDEAGPWLELAIEIDVPPDLRARVLSGAGTLAWTHGDYERATSLHTGALEQYRAIQDRAGEAFAINNLAVQHVLRDNMQQASTMFHIALQIYQELGDQRGIADVTNNIGGLAHFRGNLEQAEQHYLRSLALRRRLGNDERVAETLYNLGEIAYHTQDYPAAWSQYQESLSLFRNLKASWKVAACMAALAAAATGMHRLERAARLCGAAQSLLESVGAGLDTVEQARFDTVMDETRAGLGADLYRVLWTEGRMMTAEEAISYGLAPIQPYSYQDAHQNTGKTTLGDTVPAP